MDFKSLKYFVTVAQELNISRAAELLHMSQPPLSHQIKQLEQEYGTTLFIRSKQGLTLTDTGNILYKRARQLLELSERTREEISNYEKELSGELILGTVEGRAPFLLARWIAGFNEEFPLVTYTLRSGGTDDILDQLYHHLIDIAVIAAPYNLEMLEGFTVDHQPWVASIPADHPLAKMPGKEIRLSDLDGQPLIIPERQSRVEAIEQWFGEKGMTPKIVCKTSNYINAVSLVEQHIGICIFPQTTYTPNPLVSVKLITDPAKAAEYVLVHSKDHPLGELGQAFKDYVSDYLKEGPEGEPRINIKVEEFVLPPETPQL